MLLVDLLFVLCFRIFFEYSPSSISVPRVVKVRLDFGESEHQICPPY